MDSIYPVIIKYLYQNNNQKNPKRRAQRTATKTPSIFNREHHIEKFIFQSNVRTSHIHDTYLCKCEYAECMKVRYSISTRFTLSLHPMPWIANDTHTHFLYVCSVHVSLMTTKRSMEFPFNVHYFIFILCFFSFNHDSNAALFPSEFSLLLYYALLLLFYSLLHFSLVLRPVELK